MKIIFELKFVTIKLTFLGTLTKLYQIKIADTHLEPRLGPRPHLASPLSIKMLIPQKTDAIGGRGGFLMFWGV